MTNRKRKKKSAPGSLMTVITMTMMTMRPC